MKKFFVRAVIGAALICLCCGCGDREPRRIQRSDIAMGTVVQQSIYTVSGEESAAEDIYELLRGLEEERLSRRLETSELWAVNAAAGNEAGILLSPPLSGTMEECLEVWKRSGGAFDVTLGAVISLWDIDSWASGENDGEFVLPKEQALKEALEQCGSGRLRLEPAGNRQPESGAVQSAGEENTRLRLYLPEGMQLDLGAVGKGIALDEILRYLQGENEITGAIISVGGSVLTYGEKPDKSSWKVGIINPADVASYLGILSLEGQWCVSTSGDYERYVEAEGVRYHHILDPLTGYPADSCAAGVTVLSRSGWLSDALSTACFILGPEKGMELAKSYGAEVLFATKDGTVVMSDGMKAYYREG